VARSPGSAILAGARSPGSAILAGARSPGSAILAGARSPGSAILAGALATEPGPAYSGRAELKWVAPELRVLDDSPADLLVLHAFSDERPLSGLAGLVDWRLAGALSSWRIGGFSTGAFGERVLYPTGRRLSHPRLLFVGLGRRAEYRSDRALGVAADVIEAARGLGIRTLTTGLFHLEALASPLERVGPKLVHMLRSGSGLERVTIAADEEATRLVKDGIQFFGR